MLQRLLRLLGITALLQGARAVDGDKKTEVVFDKIDGEFQLWPEQLSWADKIIAEAQTRQYELNQERIFQRVDEDQIYQAIMAKDSKVVLKEMYLPAFYQLCQEGKYQECVDVILRDKNLSKSSKMQMMSLVALSLGEFREAIIYNAAGGYSPERLYHAGIIHAYMGDYEGALQNFSDQLQSPNYNCQEAFQWMQVIIQAIEQKDSKSEELVKKYRAVVEKFKRQHDHLISQWNFDYHKQYGYTDAEKTELYSSIGAVLLLACLCVGCIQPRQEGDLNERIDNLEANMGRRRNEGVSVDDIDVMQVIDEEKFGYFVNSNLGIWLDLHNLEDNEKQALKALTNIEGRELLPRLFECVRAEDENHITGQIEEVLQELSLSDRLSSELMMMFTNVVQLMHSLSKTTREDRGFQNHLFAEAINQKGLRSRPPSEEVLADIKTLFIDKAVKYTRSILNDIEIEEGQLKNLMDKMIEMVIEEPKIFITPSSVMKGSDASIVGHNPNIEASRTPST